jgi:two-component system, response regulator PdtaR
MNAPGTKADVEYGDNLNAASFLDGKSILLVEDEFLLALQLEELLESRGGTVRGPYRTLDDGIKAAEREHFDFAILDINLGGIMVYPLADHLLARGVPFLFLTGYGQADVPKQFHGVTQLNKPCDPAQLIATLRTRF